MRNSKRLSLTEAVAYLAPRPRSRNASRPSNISNSANNSPTQEFSDPTAEALSPFEKMTQLCDRLLDEGRNEEAVILLERQRQTATLSEAKGEILKSLTIGYARLGRWEDVEKLVDEGFAGRDETLLRLAEEGCDKCEWTTVEELLAFRFRFKGREDIQQRLAVDYYDRGEWDDAELLLTDLFRGRKEYTKEGLQAMHMLANIKYTKDEYDEAEDYAIRAVNGRRIILGPQHVLYYQSVNLLVRIYEAKGDVTGVTETSAMLPSGFRCNTPLVRSDETDERLRRIGTPFTYATERRCCEMRCYVSQRRPSLRRPKRMVIERNPRQYRVEWQGRRRHRLRIFTYPCFRGLGISPRRPTSNRKGR